MTNVKINQILACSALLVGVFLSAVSYAGQTPAEYLSATRYDAGQRVVGTISPDPDGSGQLTWLATRYVYDAHGRVKRTENGQLMTWADENTHPLNWDFVPLSSVVTGYDDFGRKTTETSFDKNEKAVSKVQYTYDAWSRVLCRAIRMNPDFYDNLPANACVLSDLKGEPYGLDRITKYEYNEYHNVTIEWRAWGTELAQKYFEKEYVPGTQRMNSIKDAKGNKTSFVYDVSKRLSRTVYPHSENSLRGQSDDTDYTEITYDSRGNIHTERKRNGEVITYEYNRLNQLNKKLFADSKKNVFYLYDARGLALHSRFKSHNGEGIVNHFDGFGRLESTTNTMSGVNRTLRYRYDENGNRTRITHADDVYFSYRFDRLNRVTGVGESSSFNNILTVGYHQNGKRDYILRSGGSRTNYNYDAAQRIEHLEQNFSGTVNDLNNRFKFNPAGQITELEYENDLYRYFGNSNEEGIYASNGLNQITSISGGSPGLSKQFNYDDNGNLTRFNGSVYTYDTENRLISVSEGASASFKYDPLGRLHELTVNGVKRQFLYDGDALVAEYASSSANVPLKRYVHGDQVDEPWVQYNGSAIGSSQRRYLHADHMGSVIAHSNTSNTVLDTLSYDTYGIPNIGNEGRFGYTGQLYLEELGLYYYKARIYHPQLGRFLQTDPIGYEDQMNLYAYVGNDPMNMVDPTGEDGVNVGLSLKVLGEGLTNTASFRYPGVTNESFDVQLKIGLSPGTISRFVIGLFDSNNPMAQGEGFEVGKGTLNLGWDFGSSEGSGVSTNIDVHAGAELLGMTATVQDVGADGSPPVPSSFELNLGPQLGASISPEVEITTSARSTADAIMDIWEYHTSD